MMYGKMGKSKPKAKSGMKAKMGKGGMAKAGASNPPNRKAKK